MYTLPRITPYFFLVLVMLIFLFHSQDLATVCQDLNLDYCLKDLLHELGADQNGKISYQEFLQKRLSLKSEIDALRKKSPNYHLTNSNASLGLYLLSNINSSVHLLYN